MNNLVLCLLQNSLKEQAPYVAADSNIIISSGECFTLPGELGTTKTSWVQEAHREILVGIYKKCKNEK